jgi:hypothetical protein
MKKIIYFILIVGAISLPSCKKQGQYPEQIQFRVWDGQNFSLEKDYPLPVCIIWQFRSYLGDWKAYKSFSQGVEIRHIIELLDSPEIKESRPGLRTNDKLTLFFTFDINHAKMLPVSPIKIVELYFDVNDGELVCPTGRSKILGEVFADKPESGLYLYHMPDMVIPQKGINVLERNLKAIRSEKNKIDRNEDVNNPAATPFYSSFPYEYLNRMEKTLGFIREEERKFKELYGVQDPNHPLQKHSD